MALFCKQNVPKWLYRPTPNGTVIRSQKSTFDKKRFLLFASLVKTRQTRLHFKSMTSVQCICFDLMCRQTGASSNSGMKTKLGNNTLKFVTHSSGFDRKQLVRPNKVPNCLI